MDEHLENLEIVEGISSAGKILPVEELCHYLASFPMDLHSRAEKVLLEQVGMAKHANRIAWCRTAAERLYSDGFQDKEWLETNVYGPLRPLRTAETREPGAVRTTHSEHADAGYLAETAEHHVPDRLQEGDEENQLNANGHVSTSTCMFRPQTFVKFMVATSSIHILLAIGCVIVGLQIDEPYYRGQSDIPFHRTGYVLAAFHIINMVAKFQLLHLRRMVPTVTKSRILQQMNMNTLGKVVIPVSALLGALWCCVGLGLVWVGGMDCEDSHIYYDYIDSSVEEDGMDGMEALLPSVSNCYYNHYIYTDHYYQFAVILFCAHLVSLPIFGIGFYCVTYGIRHKMHEGRVIDNEEANGELAPTAVPQWAQWTEQSNGSNSGIDLGDAPQWGQWTDEPDSGHTVTPSAPSLPGNQYAVQNDQWHQTGYAVDHLQPEQNVDSLSRTDSDQNIRDRLLELEVRTRKFVAKRHGEEPTCPEAPGATNVPEVTQVPREMPPPPSYEDVIQAGQSYYR